MKKYLVNSMFLLCIVGPCKFTYSQEVPSDSLIQGKIQFKETIHDFGNIEYDGNGTYEFVFKNTGETAIALENVRSSCGCTIPTWPREPILPGKKSAIKVKYDTKRIGAFTKTITVYANVEDGPIKLQIKGLVKPKEDK